MPETSNMVMFIYQHILICCRFQLMFIFSMFRYHYKKKSSVFDKALKLCSYLMYFSNSWFQISTMSGNLQLKLGTMWKTLKSWNNGGGQEWVHSQFVIFTTHTVTDVYKQPSLKSILLCIHRLIIPAWKQWEQMDKGRTSHNMDDNINVDRDV